MAESFRCNSVTSSPKHEMNGESVIIDSENEDFVKKSGKEYEHSALIDESASTYRDETNSMLIMDNSLNKTNISEDTPALLSKTAIKNHINKDSLIDTDDNDSINDKNNEHRMYEHNYTIPQSNFSSISNSFNNYDSDFLLISYLPALNKGQKRKDVTHDITREDIKKLKHNCTSTSFNEIDINANSLEDEDSDKKILNRKNSEVPVSKILDSGSEKNRESDSELSFMKQEIDVKNVDSIQALVLPVQNRDNAICKLKMLTEQVAKTKLMFSAGNIDMFPDKREKLRKSILEQENEIKRLKSEWKDAFPTSDFGSKESEKNKKPCYQAFKESILAANKKSFAMENILSSFSSSDDGHTISDDDKYMVSDNENACGSNNYLDYDDISMGPTTSLELRALGKEAQETRNKELALTVERLQDLHGSLEACPSENMKAEDPRGLQVELFPYQRHALAWLLWREQQRPPGGVLADDMGLGKTLTMISLILSTLNKKHLNDEYDGDIDDDNDDVWSSRFSCPKGGTLIVCPASLVKQWEGEVYNKCHRGVLSVYVHHGTNRMNTFRILANNDIVITTYNIVSREHKCFSALFKINWTRVILDEAHYIRNHKSQMAEAAFDLKADKRWALSGTPVQNKTMDLYSILKFLRCSPFDDLRAWRRWVDNRNGAGRTRLATIMKTLMLRRTKAELMAKGVIDSLPEKSVKEIMVHLDPQEKLVYEKILMYSRTLFAQFLHQRAEKTYMRNLGINISEVGFFLSNSYRKTPFTEAQNKLLAMHADVKTYEILVLLLRLRQVCCHPALIHAMLDQDDVKQSGIMDVGNVDSHLLSRVNRMSIYGLNRSFNQSLDESEEEDIGIDKRIVENVLTHDNPVFDDDRISSKMRALLDLVRDILHKDNDKLIIVSQWSTLLDIIASHLSSMRGATFDKFTGSVAIKHRQDIVDAFNRQQSGPRILLLSLTAGGVGLNLAGANHLLLFDIHWNPQLETQAQDRIYRVGQTKNVFIYKFICSNTIEERIKELQDNKLEIARTVLSDERDNKSESATKLTLNDLKSLFAL